MFFIMEVLHKCNLLVYCIIFTQLSKCDGYRGDVPQQKIKIQAKALGSELNEILLFMNTKDFQPSAYGSYRVEHYTDFQAKEELNRIVREMKDLTKAKEKLVEKLRTTAEENYRVYDTNQSISCSTFTYDRAKAITSLLTNETKNPTGEEKCQKKKFVPLRQNSLLYNMSVNFEKTTAHVPTNVYDGSKTILMVANWTESLDTQLIQNLKENPSLKFQYFASSHGMFKIFPGVKWHIQIDEIGELAPVDFFDCRSQTWFIEAATYPKDIVILVDKSGSMKGRRETIANLTVSEILGTLTENDFFNVLLFNESIFYADPIFSNMLLQATLKNKQRIMDMMNITPSGIADYALGLKAAFELLKESRQNEASSFCSQAIMIISDGAPDYYETLFEELNPEKDVRVFTYMIGQEASDRDNVREMACNNRGFFVQIATLADVKENVQTYLPVMARTNALHRVRYTVWTGVHESQIKGETAIQKPYVPTDDIPIMQTTTTTPDFGDDEFATPTTPPDKANSTARKPHITIFTSVAQAVYDLKEETAERNFGNMIGVTGLDVPVSEFEEIAPQWKYGVNGYVFAINNNGYVLFHPKFSPVYDGKLKPFYQNVDISEVEQKVNMTLVEGNPNYNLPLRVSMIDRHSSTEEMDVYMVTDDFRSVFIKKMKYFFKPLDGTPFSIGLALPISYDRQKRIKYGAHIKFYPYGFSSTTQENVRERYGLDVTENGCIYMKTPVENSVKILPYDFCKFNEDLIKIYQKDPTCALVTVILNEGLRRKLKCQESFLKQIDNDAAATSKEWNNLINNYWRIERMKRLGIEQVFMMRYSGLYRVFNLSMPSNPDFISEHMKGIRDSIFDTTVNDAALNKDNRKDLLYFFPPTPELVKRRMTDGKEFSIVVTSAINIKDAIAPAGIMGIQLTYSKFKAAFRGLSKECESFPDNDCYLITSNGFVIASMRDEDIGKHLGEVDCEVLNSMISDGIFSTHTVYDFQAVCTYPLMDDSAGIRLLDPITRFFGYCVWVTYNVGIALANILSSTFWGLVAAAQEIRSSPYQTFDLGGKPNLTRKKSPDGDPELVRKVERQVNICRNHTDDEDVMKCFQDFLNTLCRRIGSDSNSDCITACKSLRKFSPDHWNAHEKCVYPSKPCSKEYTVLALDPRMRMNKHVVTGKMPQCCPSYNQEKQWQILSVRNANLLMVTVFPSKSRCRCPCTPPFIRSQELTPIWSNSTQPHRRQPEWKCNVNQRKENDSTCSNVGSRPTSTQSGLLFIFIGFVAVLLQNR